MNYRSFTGIMLFLFSIIFVYANDDTLPKFSFEAFDGNSITNENVQKFGIQIILYGSPDALSNNRKQLDLVLEWFRSTEKINQLLYTVNFSSYPKLIRGLIKTQMKKTLTNWAF